MCERENKCLNKTKIYFRLQNFNHIAVVQNLCPCMVLRLEKPHFVYAYSHLADARRCVVPSTCLQSIPLPHPRLWSRCEFWKENCVEVIQTMTRPVPKFRPEGIPHAFLYFCSSYSVSVRGSTNQIRLQLQKQTQVCTEVQFCKLSDAALLDVTRNHCSSSTVSKALTDLHLLPRNFRTFWEV
jgi:hypothetical protein